MTAQAPSFGADTVAGAFAAAVARYGSDDFLQVLPETAAVYGIEPRSWTYAAADAEIRALRSRYADAGYGPGHRAGLLLLNRPECIFQFIALNGLGVSVVPINADWRAAELEFLIAHSELSVVSSIDSRVEMVTAAAAAAGRRVSIVDTAGSDIGAAPGQVSPLGSTLNADTECALLYTSGTTGRPKGCVLPNEYFVYAGQWYNSISGLCTVRPGAERMLTPLPLSHMNAMAVSTMAVILGGGCLILLDRFHPKSWWQNVRESGATIVHYLGVMPAMLLAAPESTSDRSHDVRFGFGAGVNPRHHAEFERRFGFPLLEAWAMTETGSGAVVIANQEPRHVGTGCFGVPTAQVECRVVDGDGLDVDAGVAGELLVRHGGGRPRFGFFRRYLKDELATEEAWAGGWFHTGDLVTRDVDGRFRFVDRKKNVIRRSGENISAVEVESVLSQHPSVAAIGVTGVPDAVRGDEVFACVVVHSGVATDAQLASDLAVYCRERLAYFKAPGYVAFCESLPLTPTEKVQRARLKELGKSKIAEAACFDVRALKRRDED